MKRFKLKGDIMWCLLPRNGWIRIKDIMIRWNTTWTPTHTYFSIMDMKKDAK